MTVPAKILVVRGLLMPLVLQPRDDWASNAGTHRAGEYGEHLHQIGKSLQHLGQQLRRIPLAI